MRKLTVEINPKSELGLISKQVFEIIESIKLLELLKIDFDKGSIAGIYKIVLKNGKIIEDLNLPREIEIFDLLKKDGKKYIYFIKISYQSELSKDKLREFDLDVIWTEFKTISDSKIILCVIGENKQLKRLLEVFRSFADVKIISYRSAVFEKHDILSSLTTKQRNIILIAKNNGYYEYPREINVNQLSEKIGISKSTTVEHLRKAEKQLISQILIGY